MILCTKYMLYLSYVVGFYEVLLHCCVTPRSYKAEKQVEDVRANIQKSVFQNCGMWDHSVSISGDLGDFMYLFF
jgi:hypothetical protein